MRTLWALSAGAPLGWALLVACGSGRPPPADLRSDAGPQPEGSTYDGGSFVPGTGSQPCIDQNGDTPFPDTPFGVWVEYDGSTDCRCFHKNRKGTEVDLPCGINICLQGLDQMWACGEDSRLRLYQGGGVGTTCDAATVPADAPPCTAPR